MNLCQIILLFFTIAAFFLMLFVTKPWEVPKNNKQRWGRSILTGISTPIIAISAIALVASLKGFTRNTGNCLKDLQNFNIGFWACLAIPMIIVITIANYFGYRQLIWLQSLKEKLDQKKK